MSDSPVSIIYGSDGVGGYEEKGTSSKPFRTDPTGATTQPVSASTLPLPAGAAQESGNLATLAGKDFSTQTTLAAVLAKLSSDPATQTTLAAILAKLDVALSTRAAESGGNLATLAGKDFATQTTLAAVLAQLDVALSTRASETTLAAIKSTDGVKKITDPLPAGTNEVGKIAQGTAAANASAWPSKLVDGVNAVELACADSTSIPANTRGLLAMGSCAEGDAHFLLVEEDGVLRVAAAPPKPPGASTEVVLASDDPLSITSDDYDEYTIPDGKIFHLQNISCGAEGDPSERGSRIDVIFNDNGTMRYVERVYIAGSSVFETLPDTSKSIDGTTMLGDGSTKKIRLLRHRLSGAAQEVFAVIRGYVV
ncbi:MAG: hypothetical protein MUC88_00055 [Planctomycetes bacterium]|jgi:hypothetical protein|nr:hypothetical protein [Planctomycetota bacterium]